MSKRIPRLRWKALLAVNGLAALAVCALLMLPASNGGDVYAARSGAASQSAAPTSNGWEQIFAAPPLENGLAFHFYGMAFVNRNLGFAYGGAEWDADWPTPGRVYRTTDGGETWQQVHESPGWKIAMACQDSRTCWVGGQFGATYQTTDGGDTWLWSFNYTWDDYSVATPTPVGFTGWMRSGAYTGANGIALFGGNDRVILRNTTEEPRVFHNVWPPLPFNVATWSVACATSEVCFAGQIKNVILRSADAGLTWDLTWTDAPDECNGVQQRYYGLDFLDDFWYWGWAVGSCGGIYRTTNSGLGWYRQAPEIPEIIGFRRVQMFNLDHGIAVGGIDTGHGIRAIIYGTDDGSVLSGSTWHPMEAPDTDELHGLAAFSAEDILVADWSGRIWRHSSPLATATPGSFPIGTSTPTSTPTPTALPATETPTPTVTPSVTPTPTASATPSTGALEVQTFADVNNNWIFDPGELALAGAGVQLQKDATVVADCVTDALGTCRFLNLTPDDYVLRETQPPSGYAPQFTLVTVSVTAGASLTVALPHAAVTPTPTATPTATITPTPTATATPTPQRVWLPRL